MEGSVLAVLAMGASAVAVVLLSARIRPRSPEGASRQRLLPASPTRRSYR